MQKKRRGVESKRDIAADFDPALQGMMGDLWVFAQHEGGQPPSGASAPPSG